MTTIEFLRQFRFGDYAFFDLIVSFLGMYLLSPFLSKIFLKIKIDIPKINWIFLTLPIGLLVHILTGNMTSMTKNFVNIQDHYILKVLILVLVVLGLRGIKILKKSATRH